MSQYLKQPVHIHTVFQQISQTVVQRIAGEEDSFILGTSTEELVEYYFNNYHYTPIEIDTGRSHSVEINKIARVIPASQREGPFQHSGDLKFDYEYLHVRIPIFPHPNLDKMMGIDPSRYDNGFFGEDLKWTQDVIQFDIVMKGYGINKSEDVIKSEADQSIQWIYNRIHYLEQDLDRGNKELRDHLSMQINIRKRKIAEDQARHTSLLQKINIPLYRKEEESSRHIRLDPKPLVNRVRPTPQKQVEYELDESKVLDIISVLDNQGRQFEKTPATYQKLGEEDLRNILLVNLNSLFEGKATGETFCKRGKTDIYLQIDKGNILSFECKFWDGYKVYQDTIDQLLGYLTWRMNYGVIIFFSRHKNFSNVLEEGKKAIREHHSYKGSFQEVKNSHFRSYHVLPEDEKKFVQLHHLFYSLIP
jgi:hypothetical protein